MNEESWEYWLVSALRQDLRDEQQPVSAVEVSGELYRPSFLVPSDARHPERRGVGTGPKGSRSPLIEQGWL